MQKLFRITGFGVTFFFATLITLFGHDGLWTGRLKVTGLGVSSNVSLYLEEMSSGTGYKGVMIYNPGKKSERLTSVYGYSTPLGLKILEVSDLSNPANTNLIALHFRDSKNMKTGEDMLSAIRIYQVKSTLVYDTGSLQLSKSIDALPATYQAFLNNNPPVWIKNPLVENAVLDGNKVSQNSYSLFQFGIGTSPDVNRSMVEPVMEIQPEAGIFVGNASDHTSYLKLPAPEQNEGPRILLKSRFLERDRQATVKVKIALVNEYYKDTFMLAESIIPLEVEPLIAADTGNKIAANSNETMNAVGYEYGLRYLEPAAGRKALESMAQQGNVKATAWLGYFSYFGKAGYPLAKGKGMDLMASAKEQLVKEAEKGDVEAMFLAYQVLAAPFSDQPEKVLAGNYLQRASYLGYLPAQYESGLRALADGSNDVALQLANQSFGQGFTKSALILGLMHREGKGVRKDINKALEWYQKAADAGDATGLAILAQLYADGKELPPNPAKAIALAKTAAEKGNTGAMIFIGDVFLNGNQGLKKDPKEAMKWYKLAAEAGDVQGMLGLGLMYEKGNDLGLVTDQKSAYYWINLAGINGNVTAMILLSGIYEEGTYAERSAVKSRFWRAEAEALSPTQQNGSPRAGEDLANFWKYADFSPTYYYLPYENRVVSTGPDIMGGIFGGVIGSYMESRSQMQPQFNQVELIYEKDGEKVYGATLSSSVREGIRIGAGKEVEAFARGRIKLGFMLDNVSANGIGGYQNYSIDPKLPHGSFIMRLSGGNWVNFGTHKTHRFAQGGLLDLAINDRDYTNNAGYFDVKVVVRE